MSIHGCFFGRTFTGKSHKAREVAAGFKRARVGVIALVPADQLHAWKDCAHWVTADLDLFCAKVAASKRCAVFCELADAGADKFDDRIRAMFTRGRHDGHRIFFIAQRFSQVEPTVREQCAFLWLFKTAPKAAAVLAEEFADPALLAAAGLPDRSFVFKRGNAPAVRVEVPLPPGYISG